MRCSVAQQKFEDYLGNPQPSENGGRRTVSYSSKNNNVNGEKPSNF